MAAASNGHVVSEGEGRELQQPSPQGDALIPRNAGSQRVMKMVSLILLTPQYAVLILLMRYVRTRPGPMFVTSTTVLMAECTKTLTCLLIILVQQGSVTGWVSHLYEHLISRPYEFAKVCVPSLLFVLQNNLVFVAISNLDAATFQVTYQLKILTTAVFSVVLLRKRLSAAQWFALLTLFAGVSIIQVKSAMAAKQLRSPFSLLATTTPTPTPAPSLSVAEHEKELIGTEETDTEGDQNYFTGLVAVLVCCCLSGFANVFFELLLKGGKQSVWLRNVQLGLSGIVLSCLTCAIHDGQQLNQQGFFYGYDNLVWVVVMLQSLGGLLVAAVIKYADNILKGFATAGSILLSCLASVYFFNFKMDMLFMLGTSLVLVAIYLYSCLPLSVPQVIEKKVEPPSTQPDTHTSLDRKSTI